MINSRGLGKLKLKIKQSSYIPLSSFMKYTLYDKDNGYYSQRLPFRNDYITSVHITNIFGHLLSSWISKEYDKYLSQIHLIELGGGDGTMMYDILSFLESYSKKCFKSISVKMVDISPKMIEMQKNTLKRFIDKISWSNTLDAEKFQHPVLFIGNEFFDAFPIDQYKFTGDSWKQKIFFLSEKNEISEGWHKVENTDLPLRNVGDIIERSPARIKYIEDIKNIIKKFSGSALFIDYGYLDPPYKETLQCIYKNKHCNILENITYADITALVDFNDFTPYKNYLSQRDFLLDYGIYEYSERLSKNMPFMERYRLSYAIERLVNPNYMGTIFKVIMI